MSDWLTRVQHARVRDDGLTVIITVARVRGSAPREVGAKMIMNRAGSEGTIGGGQLEFQCLQIAEQHIHAGVDGVREVRNFPLGANCGQCCGGVVDILFETIGLLTPDWLSRIIEAKRKHLDSVLATPISGPSTEKVMFTSGDQSSTPLARHCAGLLASGDAAAFVKVKLGDGAQGAFLLEAITKPKQHIAVFGAGHVGSVLVEVLAKLDRHIQWIDSRAQLLNAKAFANVDVYCLPNPADFVSHLAPGTHCVVLTYSHALDFDICAKLLSRQDIPFCGLIGSTAKRARLIRLLKQAGVINTDLQDRLTCPIGIDGITGKTPAEIAISVAAQLLSLDDPDNPQQALAEPEESTIVALHH